jgi:hypothetical protein
VKKLAAALLSCALLSAACSGGDNTGSDEADSKKKPSITSFTANPANIAPGDASLLKWSTKNARRLSIDHGVGDVTGLTEWFVIPSATTTYTLTAYGSGSSKDTAKVTITVGQSGPTISSFTASPSSITQGQSATLSFTTVGATSLSIDNGVGDVSGKSSVTVTPAATTTYTLTATNASGSTTAQATVTVTAPQGGTKLAYVDPSAGALRLVKNASSSDAHAVLDLVVGDQPLTGFGVALNLPLDAAKVQYADGNLVPTSAMTTFSTAKLPSSGPMAGVLTVGVARKKGAKTDGDVALAAGTLLFTITLDLKAQAPLGTVFDGASPGAGFRAALLSVDGSEVVSSSAVAVGALSVQ